MATPKQIDQLSALLLGEAADEAAEAGLSTETVLNRNWEHFPGDRIAEDDMITRFMDPSPDFEDDEIRTAYLRAFDTLHTQSAQANPTNDIDRGLILDEGEIFARTGSHRQRHKAESVLGRKPQTYYNLFEGDKTAGASRFVVTEEEFQKLKDNRVKVTRSRLKTPNNWHPHFLNNPGGRSTNPGTPPTPAADLTRRLKF